MFLPEKAFGGWRSGAGRGRRWYMTGNVVREYDAFARKRLRGCGRGRRWYGLGMQCSEYVIREDDALATKGLRSIKNSRRPLHHLLTVM